MKSFLKFFNLLQKTETSKGSRFELTDAERQTIKREEIRRKMREEYYRRNPGDMPPPVPKVVKTEGTVIHVDFKARKRVA